MNVISGLIGLVRKRFLDLVWEASFGVFGMGFGVHKYWGRGVIFVSVWERRGGGGGKGKEDLLIYDKGWGNGGYGEGGKVIGIIGALAGGWWVATILYSPSPHYIPAAWLQTGIHNSHKCLSSPFISFVSLLK